MTFKTGDKGKTRGGDYYEVVAVLDREDVKELVILWYEDDNSGPIITTRHLDGTFGGIEHQDLLPPKQKIEDVRDIKPELRRISKLEEDVKSIRQHMQSMENSLSMRQHQRGFI